MKNFSYSRFIFLINFIAANSILSISEENGQQIIFDLLEKFQISTCAFISDGKGAKKNIVIVKKFSSRNVFSIVLDDHESNYYILSHHLENYYTNAMVIFNGSQSPIIEQIFETYFEVGPKLKK